VGRRRFLGFSTGVHAPSLKSALGAQGLRPFDSHISSLNEWHRPLQPLCLELCPDRSSPFNLTIIHSPLRNTSFALTCGLVFHDVVSQNRFGDAGDGIGYHHNNQTWRDVPTHCLARFHSLTLVRVRAVLWRARFEGWFPFDEETFTPTLAGTVVRIRRNTHEANKPNVSRPSGIIALLGYQNAAPIKQSMRPSSQKLVQLNYLTQREPVLSKTPLAN
jgi:hypothetical protein